MGAVALPLTTFIALCEVSVSAAAALSVLSPSASLLPFLETGETTGSALVPFGVLTLDDLVGVDRFCGYEVI